MTLAKTVYKHSLHLSEPAADEQWSVRYKNEMDFSHKSGEK